jgi:chromosomal replication initiator protein
MNTECWAKVRQELLSEVGQAAYKNWIEPLDLVELRDGVAQFGAPTSFFGNWVSRNYGDSIRSHFESEGVSVERLEFVASSAPKQNSRSSAQQPARKAAASVTRPVSDGADLPAAPLDKRFTFDSFVVGKPNELAHAASRRVAKGGPVTFNPLFLYGGVGLGKTHLMHAIAWEVQARDPNARVLYLSAEQFMYRFVQALRFKDTMSFKELFRSVDVLMVDDVQFIAGKDSTQDEFFHTFNALIDQNKQIIISADRAPGEIDGLEDRIKSRLQWGLVVDQCPRAGRRVDAALCLCLAGRARSDAGRGAGMSGRYPAGLGPQGDHRRDHPEGRRPL